MDSTKPTSNDKLFDFTSPIFIISIVGVVVYFNALFSDFVWDDKQYVLPNAAQYGLHILKLFQPNNFNSFGYYQPIPALWYSFIYTFFGATPFFFHLFQIALHILNAVLLYKLFKTFFHQRISLLLSLIFLVHPVQTESVSYIATAMYPMILFFGISALLLSRKSKPSTRTVVATFFLLLLGMLSKEPGIIFLLLIPAFRYLYFCHSERSEGSLCHARSGIRQRSFMAFRMTAKRTIRDIFKKGTVLNLCLLVLLTYLFLRLYIGHTYFYSMNFVPMARLSLPMRLLNIPDIMLYYITHFFFPKDLAIMQYWTVTSISLPIFYLPLVIDGAIVSLIMILGVAAYQTKQLFPTFLFFLLWLILSAGMYLQIIPADLSVADRYFYIPIVGALGLIGVSYQLVQTKFPQFKKAVYIFFITSIILLSVRTIIRNVDWQHPMQLYAHDILIADSYNLEAHMGYELLTISKYDQALTHYKKALTMLPNEADISTIGYIYERKKDLSEAKKYYDASLSAPSSILPYRHQSSTYENIARYQYYYGNKLLAKKYILQGLAEYPMTTDLWVLLALDEYSLQHYDAALTAIKKAHEITPSVTISALYNAMKTHKPINIPIQTFYSY